MFEDDAEWLFVMAGFTLAAALAWTACVYAVAS
jgi:hypothetical protein